MRGEEEQMEFWSEIMEGGSQEVALETSEKAGEVKGVSIGRLIEGKV